MPPEFWSKIREYLCGLAAGNAADVEHLKALELIVKIAKMVPDTAGVAASVVPIKTIDELERLLG